MQDFAFGLIDGIVACFTQNMSWKYLASTFWFLIFIEFPRYYFLDVIMAIRHGLTWKSRARKNAVARRLLFIERPLVSIIVPGKNEGPHIYKLLQSLHEQTYDHWEIIIVDDGSDDTTPSICRDLLKAGLIHQYYRMAERGGKASAANYALMHAKGKYLVHLDADSSLDRDALEKILIPFYLDRYVRGVGGCIKVRNADDTMCTSMQALEYMRTIQIGRMGTDMLGIYHIISGAFGAFETQTLRELGGWDIGPGLDGDVTQKIRKAGYKVRFAYDAICMTNVPSSWGKLFKQRLRWSKSLVRFRIRKHRDIFRSDRNYKFINVLSNLDNILFDCLFNYVWCIYIITLCFAATDRFFDIMIVGWILRMSFSFMSFVVMQCISERSREERPRCAQLIFFTFYMGYFLRVCRLVGHTLEFFLYSSYQDNWNPRKTSVIAQAEGM